MINVIDTLWLLAGGIILTVILGIIAGFSPTLYITQVGIGVKNKKVPYMISIMIGVVGALIVLTVLFQFFQLNTLIQYIDETVRALLLSVVFNILIGAAMIVGGVWYIKHRNHDPEVKSPKKIKKAGYAALISFGFLRTFLSITGISSTFVASNVIAEASPGIITRIVSTIMFLAASILPFVAIIFLLKSNPEKLDTVVDFIKKMLNKFNYRPVIGVIAILFGSSIVIINVLVAVFY